MFCSKCGSQIPSGNNFCSNCGEKVNNDSTVNIDIGSQIPSNKSNNKRPLIIVLCILGAILITVLGYNIYKQVLLHITDNKVKEELNNIDDFDSISNEDVTENKKTVYEEGNAVTLVDGSNWHVVSYDKENKKIVLLLDSLLLDNMPYGPDSNASSQMYENSNIKQYIENTYLPQIQQSINLNGGDSSNISARLLTSDEYLKLTGDIFSNNNYNMSSINFNRTSKNEDNIKWLAMTSTFWTMSNIKNYTNTKFYGAYAVFVASDNAVSLYSDYSAQEGTMFKGSYYGVRPVIETTIKNIK